MRLSPSRRPADTDPLARKYGDGQILEGVVFCEHSIHTISDKAVLHYGAH